MHTYIHSSHYFTSLALSLSTHSYHCYYHSAMSHTADNAVLEAEASTEARRNISVAIRIHIRHIHLIDSQLRTLDWLQWVLCSPLLYLQRAQQWDEIDKLDDEAERLGLPRSLTQKLADRHKQQVS